MARAAPPPPSPGERSSLDDWLAYISALHSSTIALGLERVQDVAARLGLLDRFHSASSENPAPVVITVGGTNGKGSICAFLERILLECGYLVGCYTSPHLLRYNERVRIAGDEATDDVLARAFTRVEAARAGTPLTYFEFGTLAALVAFEEARIEAAVLEVGLGGRLDAVNLIDADCAVVASVDIDHVDYLGDTREAIGFEKAGIFRRGRPAICGDPQPPQSLVDHAAAVGAELQVLGKEFGFQTQERQWDFLGRRGAKRALPIPALRGAWQLCNAACALAALDELAGRLPVSLGEVKRGLTLATVPGRLQVLPGKPTIVLDVAHNPHAARALAKGMGAMGFFETTYAVFAMLGDKDIAGVIDAMHGVVDRWFVTTTASERAAPAADIARLLEARGLAGAMRTFANVDAALAQARREATPNDRIVVFGSFYTVADALRCAR